MATVATRIVITPVDPARIIDLRHAVLRDGYDRASAIFAGDTEPHSHHVAAVLEGAIIGCASLHRRPYEPQIADAWQLRGMAVHPGHRKAGIGRRLLEALEQHVRQAPFAPLIWCNARTPAVPFYMREGWQIVSAEYQIPTAGPHYKLLKHLPPIAKSAAASTL